MAKEYVIGKIKGHALTVGMSAGALLYLLVDVFKNVQDANENKNALRKDKQIPVNLLQLNTIMKEANVFSANDLVGVKISVMEDS